jgi:hypothetical protein
MLEQREQYWQRSLDNFVPIPHGILRWLFHPRAHPSFSVVAYVASSRIIAFDLVNDGTGSAEGVFVRCSRQITDGNAIVLPVSHWSTVFNSAKDDIFVTAWSCAVAIHPSQQVPMCQIHLGGHIPEGYWLPPTIEIVIFSRDQAPERFAIRLQERPKQPVEFTPIAQ